MNTATTSYLSDFELINQFKSGKKHSFGELYDRHYQLVYSRCYQLCRDENIAFDLTQEVMLKAFDHLNEFRGESHFKTWLYTIASRHCYSYLHKKKTGVELTDQMADSLPEENNDDLHSTMLTLIHKLPADEKNLLLKKYEQGISIEDLQEELNVSASAIKMRLKRSREKLNLVYSLSLTFGLDYAINMLELM